MLIIELIISLFKNVENNLKGITMQQLGSLVLKLTNKEVTEQEYYQLTIIAIKQLYGQALSHQDFASILGCSKSYIYKILGLFEKETGVDPATNYIQFIEWASSHGILKASSLATLALFEKIKLIQKSASLSSLREVWKDKSPEDVFAD